MESDARDAADARDASTETLIGRSLLARYFIDEAASGQLPTELADAAPNPFPLALHYTTQMAYTNVSGAHGLRWISFDDDGRGTALVMGSKLQALNGAQRWTFEVVVDLRDAGNGGEVRLVSIANGTAGFGA